MPSAPAVAPDPPTTRQRVRPNGCAAAGDLDFQLRHWRAAAKRAAPSLRWAPPPAIEIPGGGAGQRHGYTSLRDILSSPEHAGSPAGFFVNGGAGAGCCGGADVHAIRHPLVKHAAYAYLQMTPSAREDRLGRRGRHRRGGGPLCRLLLDCISFIGALFRP